VVTKVKSADFRKKELYKFSGGAALILGLLFVIAVIILIMAQLGILNGWLSQLQNIWLIKLLQLNAGINGVSFNMMHGLNLPDIIILVLVFVVHIGLYTTLRRTSKIWSVIALVQPFLGILIFVITEEWGRSAVMGAGLVISIVMLRSNIFGKTIAFLGIMACVLLLVGDFSTSDSAHSIFVAFLIGIGFTLLTIWFFLVGKRLLRLGMNIQFEKPLRS
jgi:hypothetical protein